MSDSAAQPWLELTLEGESGAPVDARDVGDLLVKFSTAARQVAADMLGSGDPKGRRSQQEHALTGFTLKTIGPGSALKIELEPPVVGLSVRLFDNFAEPPTPALVVRDLVADLTGERNSDRHPRQARRNAIDQLSNCFAKIAPHVSLQGRCWEGEAVTIRPRRIASDRAQNAITVRRVYFGRATMADADPNHRQLRASLYNGTHCMLDVPDNFPSSLSEIFDKHLEFRVLEQVSDGSVLRSDVEAVRLLDPAEIGFDLPSKDWSQLASEQGIDLSDPPDYPALLNALFESEADIQAFREHLYEFRGGDEYRE